MIDLRPATAADQKRIEAIIRAARINPFDLKWPHFTLAIETASGEIVGTIQVKTHGDGSHELASLTVAPAWRGRGLARRLIEHVLATTPGALYLTCRQSLGKLYSRFGFRAIVARDMPPYFRRLSRVAAAVGLFLRRQDTMLVMRRDEPAAGQHEALP